MKANELRIGNLFKYSDNAIIKPEKRGVISSIIADDISFLAHSYNENLIEPITLTEEWLLSFGFDKITELTDGYNKGMPIEKYLYDKFYILNTDLLNPNFGIGLHYIWDGISLEIKYVHQLQNLYFALTGEELTLKQ